MTAEGKAQGFGRNERIAVAVAADPAADFQDIGNVHIGICRLKVAFHITVELGQGFEKAHREDGHAVVDFVVDAEFVVARFAGLPQAQQDSVDFTAQRGQRIGVGAAFPTRQQSADTAVEAQNSLALHFGRMRGQDGGNSRIVELLLHRFAVDFSGSELAYRFRQAAFRTAAARIFINLTAAFVVHVFGNVQNLCEQSAGKRQVVGLLFVQLRQNLLNQCRAIVRSGQQLDRFHHQRRGFLVKKVE